MPTTYCYIPFPEKLLTDRAAIAGQSKSNTIYSNLSIVDGGGKHIGVSSRGHFMQRTSFRGVRPLDVVKQDDTLIVSAHGIGGSGSATNPNFLGASVRLPSAEGGSKEKMATIEPAWLAQRMNKDGLTKDIRVIQLSVCFSGLSGGHVFSQRTPMVDPDDAPTQACLASLLAQELGKLGYEKVVVSGATGEVTGNLVTLGYARIDGSHIAQKVSFEEGSRHFAANGLQVRRPLSTFDLPTRTRGQTVLEKPQR